MPTREILQLGNKMLWEKSRVVDDSSSLETQSVVRDLSDTLSGFRATTGFGRGIAAPQIGVLK
jgi:peptide deformylase